MPLTPEQRAKYGPDWATVSLQVRERSGGRCECEGECGWSKHLEANSDLLIAYIAEHGTQEGYDDDTRCQAYNGQPSPYTGSRVVLTAAHLDQDGHTGVHDQERIKAMCQGCHLSLDRQARGLAQAFRRAEDEEQEGQ